MARVRHKDITLRANNYESSRHIPTLQSKPTLQLAIKSRQEKKAMSGPAQVPLRIFPFTYEISPYEWAAWI